MAGHSTNSRVVAGLWLVAGILAWTAVAIGASRGRGVNWSIAAAGLFCVAMGIGAWARTRAQQGQSPRTP